MYHTCTLQYVCTLQYGTYTQAREVLTWGYELFVGREGERRQRESEMAGFENLRYNTLLLSHIQVAYK